MFFIHILRIVTNSTTPVSFLVVRVLLADLLGDLLGDMLALLLGDTNALLDGNLLGALQKLKTNNNPTQLHKGK